MTFYFYFYYISQLLLHMSLHCSCSILSYMFATWRQLSVAIWLAIHLASRYSFSTMQFYFFLMTSLFATNAYLSSSDLFALEPDFFSNDASTLDANLLFGDEDGPQPFADNIWTDDGSELLTFDAGDRYFPSRLFIAIEVGCEMTWFVGTVSPWAWYRLRVSMARQIYNYLPHQTWALCPEQSSFLARRFRLREGKAVRPTAWWAAQYQSGAV